MKRLIPCFFIILSILSETSCAQQKISQASFSKSKTDDLISSINGTVTDNKGVGIFFYLEINGVYVDNKLPSGNFHVKVAPGKYTVEFIALGFLPTKPLIIEVAKNETYKFKVVLLPGPPLVD